MSIKELAQEMETMLLETNPKRAFRIVALIKDAGISDLFIMLGQSNRLTEYLKKGRSNACR